MTERITPGQIKKSNRQQIYEYIYRKGDVAQQDISYALNLSRPTVAANIAELEKDGMICKSGRQNADQIGRKAVTYSTVSDFRIAIGVEITTELVKIIAINLYGEKIERIVAEIPYENQTSYYNAVTDSILAFIRSLGVREEQILGIGIAMEGLVSADGTTIVYGKILDNTGIKIDVFARGLPFPCMFVHDPDGAALSELWMSPELTDAVYLSLSQHLGGSIISRGTVMTGKHGHSATFEHIRIRPKGDRCYCGGRGCLETICSMNALLMGEEPDGFFEAVRRGAPEPRERWQTYLKNLAGMIRMLHLIYDVDFILGGHLAPYFTESDIRFLYEEIQRGCPFEEKPDFIRISKMPSHNITIGAALPYIQGFLKDSDPKKPVSVPAPARANI